MEMELIYNAVSVSGVQPNDSVTQNCGIYSSPWQAGSVVSGPGGSTLTGSWGRHGPVAEEPVLRRLEPATLHQQAPLRQRLSSARPEGNHSLGMLNMGLWPESCPQI